MHDVGLHTLSLAQTRADVQGERASHNGDDAGDDEGAACTVALGQRVRSNAGDNEKADESPARFLI